MNSQHKLLIFLIFFLFLGLFTQWYQHTFNKEDILFSTLTVDHKNITSTTPLKNENKLIRIHVAGAVQRPGVYDVPSNLRVLDILDLVGGVLPGANLDKINLAQKIKDGQRLFIELKKELPILKSNKTNQHPIKISLNQASYDQLLSIPGIGPKTAKLILSYKKEIGHFSSLDQLLKIKGIGQKTLEKLIVYISL